MTIEEIRWQKANLYINLEDAQQDLACLREKALALADTLEETATAVRRIGNLTPSKADFSAEYELSNRLEQSQFPALDSAVIVALFDQLAVARKRVFNLQERFSQLSGTPTAIE